MPANTAPMMLFGGGAKPAKTGKKVAKKAVKKVAKKVNKTVRDHLAHIFLQHHR